MRFLRQSREQPVARCFAMLTTQPPYGPGVALSIGLENTVVFVLHPTHIARDQSTDADESLDIRAQHVHQTAELAPPTAGIEPLVKGPVVLREAHRLLGIADLESIHDAQQHFQRGDTFAGGAQRREVACPLLEHHPDVEDIRDLVSIEGRDDVPSTRPQYYEALCLQALQCFPQGDPARADLVRNFNLTDGLTCGERAAQDSCAHTAICDLGKTWHRTGVRGIEIGQGSAS